MLLQVVNLYKYLAYSKKEFVMSKQVLKSGVSVGVREAEFTQSKTDFISKMSINLKEVNETDDWLYLLHGTNYIDDKVFKEKSIEMIKLLVRIVKSAKA